MSVLTTRDDRILPLTRIALLIVVVFLGVAFVILYLFPETIGEHFAWKIVPNMTALLMGAGYLGGAYQFVFTIFEKRWHRTAAAFLPVTAFTVAMLLATFLHWDRFDIHRFPFQVWLVIYIAAPFLVFYLWLRNRVTDPLTLEPGDVRVPGFIRAAFFIFGVATTAAALVMFISPQTIIPIWFWKLTPLTGRILASFFGLLGVGGLTATRDARWSSWHIPLQSNTLWWSLVLIGAFRYPQDFAPAGVWNVFTLGVLIFVVIMFVFQVGMEILRKSSHF